MDSSLVRKFLDAFQRLKKLVRLASVSYLGNESPETFM
jgi:hypothetical protein